jgi:hypothetical protein
MRASLPEPRWPKLGRPLRPPPARSLSPSGDRRGSDASQLLRRRSARQGSTSSQPRGHSRLPFGTYTASATWRARERGKLSTQPTTSHARAVAGTTAVGPSSSSSTFPRMPSSCLWEATAARTRCSDFAAGVRIRSRCRYRGVVLSVHLREPHRFVHPMPTEARGERWSRSRRRRSGRPRSLPSRGSHGSGRAEFPHPALRGTVFATRHGRTHGDGSGYRCSNRRIAVGGSPRCERRRSQCHHAQTTRYRKSQTRRRLPLRP